MFIESCGNFFAHNLHESDLCHKSIVLNRIGIIDILYDILILLVFIYLLCICSYMMWCLRCANPDSPKRDASISIKTNG